MDDLCECRVIPPYESKVRRCRRQAKAMAGGKARCEIHLRAYYESRPNERPKPAQRGPKPAPKGE